MYFFKNGCKGSAKFNIEVNLVYPRSQHNHNVEEYNAKIHEIKTKIKRKAMTSRDNLREIFNEITRSDPAGSLVTFRECESSMFRARKSLQPKIPQSAIEFCKQLPSTNFALQLRPFFLQLNRLLMQLPIQLHNVRPFVVHLEAFLDAFTNVIF